jgi:hypothetical protein
MMKQEHAGVVAQRVRRVLYGAAIGAMFAAAAWVAFWAAMQI